MSRPLHALPLAAALALASLTPALAQGTSEQREACTPDAVKLCSDTIPDIPKTTACMERHRAELTPRCRAAMAPEAAPPPARKAEAPPPPRKRAARETPDADRPSRRAAREPRREDDRPRARRDDYGPPDGPDGPDERRAGRDDGPDRYGYGPRGGDDDGPQSRYGRDDDGPDGPPPGYGPPDGGGRRADRDDGPPPGYVPPGERRYRYLAPNGDPAMTPEGGARARARAEIGRLCDDEMLDPRTCAETDRALRR